MKKPIIGLLLCLWVAVFLVSPRNHFYHLHHTWTLAQVKTAVCSATPCSVTITAATGGNLLVANLLNDTTTSTISSVTAGACNVAWVISAATAMTQTGDGSGEFAYCLNAVAGTTAVAISMSTGCAASSCSTTIWEASSSTGSIALDTGATPAGKVSDTTCTSCAGAALSLSANNKFIAVSAAAGNTCTGLTGTGFTNDFTSLGDCQGHGINIATSGTVTSPATWTQGSGTLIGNAIAFQEAAGAGASTMPAVVF